MDTYICAFLVSLATAAVLTPIARRLAVRLDIVDRPDGNRKLQAAAVPLLGGVAVYSSLVIGLIVTMCVFEVEHTEFGKTAWLLIGTAGFVCLFGCIDDRYELKPRTKLLLQILATLPIVLCGHCVERTVLFGFPVELGWLSIPLTILWLVACINAVNLLDGMDGLASIVGLSTVAMITLIAMDSSHAHVALLAIILAGALVGFLAYNLPPASIYLGDSGSMVIGLVVGFLAMQSAMKSSATLSLMIPAVVMTIPLLDTALAVVRRKLSGSSFDVADRGHIHHCLLKRGLTVWQSLCIIAALCVATGAAAAAASIWHLEALAWVAAITVATLLIRTRAFGHYELSLVKLATANLLARFARRLADSTGIALAARDEMPDASSFDQAWQALISEAARLDAIAVELRRVHPSSDQVIRRWSDRSHTQASCNWQFTLRQEAAPDAWVELQTTGTGTDAAQGWNHLQLNRLLQRFHRNWAARAVVLAEEARLAVADASKSRASEDGVFELQRAA